MPKKFPLFKASIGLNNAVDPTRIKYDSESGLVDLQASINVELDKSGALFRRKGYSEIISGSFHSVFSMGSYAIAVWNFLAQHYIIWFDAAGRSGVIVEVVQYNNRMCYARIGDKVYYSNEAEKGIIEGKIASSWSSGSVVAKDSTRTFSDPPAGHILEIAHGRMWIAKDEMIYFSEPFGYNLFDYARGWLPTIGRASLLRGILGGLYISDNNGVYFCNSTDPKTMQPFKVHDFPAIIGTDVTDLISGISLGLQDSYLYCLFLTEKGLCAAGPEGRFINLTEDKLVYPKVTSGSAVLKSNDNILFLLNG